MSAVIAYTNCLFTLFCPGVKKSAQAKGQHLLFGGENPVSERPAQPWVNPKNGRQLRSVAGGDPDATKKGLKFAGAVTEKDVRNLGHCGLLFGIIQCLCFGLHTALSTQLNCSG
jgi:hypothetical protein